VFPFNPNQSIHQLVAPGARHSRRSCAAAAGQRQVLCSLSTPINQYTCITACRSRSAAQWAVLPSCCSTAPFRVSFQPQSINIPVSQLFASRARHSRLSCAATAEQCQVVFPFNDKSIHLHRSRSAVQRAVLRSYCRIVPGSVSFQLQLINRPVSVGKMVQASLLKKKFIDETY
jgi:hypothetical protein